VEFDAYLVINVEETGNIGDVFATLRNTKYVNFVLFMYILIFQNIFFLLIYAGERLMYIGVVGMFSWIVLLPLCSSICCGFFGRFIGTYGSMWISTSCLISSAILSCLAFYYVGLLDNELMYYFFE
jgi:ABC-type transport system involved in multi-copper enzyme maturation permease subunit